MNGPEIKFIFKIFKVVQASLTVKIKFNIKQRELLKVINFILFRPSPNNKRGNAQIPNQ